MRGDERARAWWDSQASALDAVVERQLRTPRLLSAWTSSVAELLPPAPAAVVDMGAGTGFLSLIAASVGHRVVAVDSSSEMLRVLSSKADARGLSVEVVCADVEDGVAGGPFDAVMERHVLGVLPRPRRALDAWRLAAPTGWLVCFEADEPRLGGSDAALEVPGELARGLPYPDGLSSGEVLELVGGSEWGEARKERLKRVARAERLAGSWGDRLLGVSRRYAVQAGLA